MPQSLIHEILQRMFVYAVQIYKQYTTAEGGPYSIIRMVFSNRTMFNNKYVLN